MSLLQHLNKRNFQTLFRALKSEPLPVILRNIRNLVSGKSISAMHNQAHFEHTTGLWKLYVDFVIESERSDALIVYGWIVYPAEQQDHTLLVDGDPVSLFFDRLDIYHNHVKPSEGNLDGSGFIYIIKKDTQSPEDQTSSVQVKWLDDNDNELTILDLNANPISHSEMLHLHRNLQYSPYTAIKDAMRPPTMELPLQPKISICVPVYNVDIEYLQPCVESVVNQTYTNWELCLCDDASTRADTRGYLKALERQNNKNIKVIWSEENGNISVASNKAVAAATGEFICLLDHDDLLHSDALLEVVKAINANSNVDILYSDEDKLDQEGFRVEPYYKPQYSPQLLLANNYICHLLVIRKSVGDQIEWFREGYEGAQDHDLILRLTEKTSNIVHIPKVLYHWRKIEGSTALSHGEKSYANKAGVATIKSYLKRNNIKGKVKKGAWIGAYRIKYALHDTPKIAIVIPFKDQVAYLKTCLSSIFKMTTYQNFEIILVDNNSEKQKTADYLKKYEYVENVRILTYDKPFNYSKINNWAINQTDAEVILLLNNDIKVITKDWLTTMYSYLQQSHIGAVGTQLLYDDMTSQHSGVVTGIGGVAGHAFKGLDSRVHHYYLDGLPRNVSGCTAACLMVKKSIWSEVNGLNEEDLTVAFNDVDFCLKIRKAGHEILYIPEVQLFHYESKSRGYEDTPEKVARFKTEEKYMKDTWGDTLTNDPYYNPNMTLLRQDYGLNMEGVIQQYLEFKAQGK